MAYQGTSTSVVKIPISCMLLFCALGTGKAFFAGIASCSPASCTWRTHEHGHRYAETSYHPQGAASRLGHDVRTPEWMLSGGEELIDSEDVPSLRSLPGVKTVVETEEEEAARAAREWADDGRKGRVIVRRREGPLPEHSFQDACRIVLQALQLNDDPILDYGAAVAIKFASSSNFIRTMTPADYGAFLRSDEDYSTLIDNSRFGPAGTPKVSADGNHVLQQVEVIGQSPQLRKRLIDVQLSKEDDCWKVDAITFAT